jgi:hypothetical protein
VIIETKLEFNSFIKKYQNSDCILIPVLSDVNKHPLQNKLCLIYIKILDGDEYLLSFNHSESLNLSTEFVSLLNELGKKYTYDKKRLNHIVKLHNVVDINLLYYMDKNQPLYIDDITTNTHDYFYRRLYRTKNINEIIPILKHLELCRKLSGKFLEVLSLPIYEKYNDEVIDNLTYLESSGLRYNNELIYSEYNLYTSTGRPSNRFGGINFAALNKTDGSRKPFKSRFKNGMLVEYDYDSYHMRLIGELIGYKFSSDSVHEHMAKFYGNVSYNESKDKSFQYLYGHIPREVIKSNPFFSKVSDYINELWKLYKKEDFITSNIYSKKIFRKNLSDMSRNKLFNYLIQLMETETNMKMLSELIPFLKSHKSKLILYSYDSFLIDLNLDDGVEFLKNTKSIIENNGLYPTKVSRGTNYHKMENITDRL